MPADYQYWPLDALADHIQVRQGALVGDHLPAGSAGFRELCALYRKIHPEIVEISHEYHEAAREIGWCADFEVSAIFPYIRELVRCHHSGEEVDVPAFHSLSTICEGLCQRQEAALSALESVNGMTVTFGGFAQVDPVHKNLATSLAGLHGELRSIVDLKFGVLLQRSVMLENTVGRRKMARRPTIV